MNTRQLYFEKMTLINELLSFTDLKRLSEISNIIYHPDIINKSSMPRQRKLGILKGKMTFSEIENGKITIDEFLGI